MTRNLIFLVFLLPTGCAGFERVPVTHFFCPNLVTYTEAEQEEAAAEMDAIRKARPQSELLIMLRDYARERAALLACKK